MDCTDLFYTILLTAIGFGIAFLSLVGDFRVRKLNEGEHRSGKEVVLLTIRKPWNRTLLFLMLFVFTGYITIVKERRSNIKASLELDKRDSKRSTADSTRNSSIVTKLQEAGYEIDSLTNEVAKVKLPNTPNFLRPNLAFSFTRDSIARDTLFLK